MFGVIWSIALVTFSIARLFLGMMILVLVARATANAGMATSPIKISECRFPVFTVDAYSGELSTTQWGKLWVNFQNTGDGAITAVTFDAVHAGEHLVLTDKGRFTKGADVKHELVGVAKDWHGDPGLNSCNVTAIHFADGRSETY